MAPAVTTRSGTTVGSAPGTGGKQDDVVVKDGHRWETTTHEPRKDASNLDILSGDHGLEKRENLKDFIWTLTGEPHAQRRKEMMKELGPQINELRGYEPRTKYIVVLLLALHIGIGFWMKDEALYGGTLKFWVVTYVFGATLAQILFLANHEISHNLAFKGVKANKVFAIITNTPRLVPYFIAFKEYHNEHHKEQGSPNDSDLPTELEAWLLSSVPGKLFYMFNQTWFYAFRPVIIKPKPFTAWHLLNVIVQVAFCYAVVQTGGWGPIFYFLGSAHFAGSIHPMASHFIAEHYTFVGEAETCSYYGWMNWLTWNVGYHNEHHDFPNVPGSQLPKLREIGAKYYDHLPYHESWVGALWEFLFNPNVSLYNRVKREAPKKAN